MRNHCSTTTMALAVPPSSLSDFAISSAIAAVLAKIAPLRVCTLGLGFKTTIKIKSSLRGLGRYSLAKSVSGIGKRFTLKTKQE